MIDRISQLKDKGKAQKQILVHKMPENETKPSAQWL